MIRIVMGDPNKNYKYTRSKNNDAFAIAGIDLDLDTRHIYPRLAQQWHKSDYDVIGRAIDTIYDKVKPSFLGMESNTYGKDAIKYFRSKFNLPVRGVYTSANLTDRKTISKGYAMDKSDTIHWVKNHRHNFTWPKNPAKHMALLMDQWYYMTEYTTLGGQKSYRAGKGHDDLFMAFLLCCHVARKYMEREDRL